MESLEAYSRYLAVKAQAVGLTTLDGHKPTADELRILSEIHRICEWLARILPRCSVGDIASLTGHYSMLYTIGYRRWPGQTLLSEQRERLLRSWQTGDPAVAESDVYGMLSDPVVLLSASHRRILSDMRRRWVEELTAAGTFADVDACERYRRLTLIMRDNIDDLIDSDSAAAKAEWFRRNRIDDIAAVGTRVLCAYRQFIGSLFPAVLTAREMTALDMPVLRELTGRPDLSDYDREAFRLALAMETNENA